MKLIVHHALKDLRAQRWLVAGWAAALLASCVIEGLKLDVWFTEPSAPRSGPGSRVSILVVLAMTRTVLGWLLAIRIVHADPLDGADAFWLTRPMSPRMLLAAKAGLIGVLLGVIPGVCALVVFAANGVPLHALPASVAAWIAADFLLLSPLILLATLTRDLARIVLAVLVGLVLWNVLQVAATVLQVAVTLDEQLEPGFMALACLSFISAAVLITLSLVRWQFLSRRTARTAIAAAIVVLVFGATGVLLSAWFRPALTYHEPSVDHPWSGASRVSLDIPAETIRTMSYQGAYIPGTAVRAYRNSVFGELTAGGVGPGLILDVDSSRSTFRATGTGEAFTEDGAWWGASRVGIDKGREEVERAAGARIINVRTWWPGSVLMLSVPGGVYDQHQGTSGSYELELVLQAYRVSASAVIPLRAGASGSVRSVGMTVLSVRPGPKIWAVDVRESLPRTFVPGQIGRTLHLLRNRKRGEALILAWDTYPMSRVPAGGLANAFMIVNRTSLEAGLKISDDRTIDRSWFGDAELVLIEMALEGGAFARRVTISNLTLPELYVKGERSRD
jgi:hypothetical protein